MTCARAPRTSGVDFDEHLTIVIGALTERRDVLLPAEAPADALVGTHVERRRLAVSVVVLEGDQTGQELLEQSLRVLDPELLGLDLDLPHFDLSLEQPARDVATRS